MDDSKKKLAVVGVCSVILVAMVVAIVVDNRGGGEEQDSADVSASQKAITTICDTTDYKKTCVDSLRSAGTNSTDPRELIQVVFQAVIKYLNEAAENSTTLQKLQTDPRAKSALATCRELAKRAVNDLQRSYAKFNSFDMTNVEDILMDLKVWLSGAITHQETCLDGFQDVSGDAGHKMKDALETAMRMSSNALAMVEELSTFLESMGFQTFKRRRLLSDDLGVLGHGDEFPNWMDLDGRRLLTASPRLIRPNLVVAKDGSGKYTTINEALKHVPKKRNETFVLYIKEGTYEEQVKINSSLTHLLVIGDGPTKTRITGKLNFIDGVGTYHTATVAVHGDNFIARDIGFENSAGPQKHQAVALRISADKAVFYNCHIDGYQDTLYAHTYRQFYRDCVISGTIDFIFGDGAVVLQGCMMLVRKPLDNQQCIVTAQGRKDVRQPTGLVLQNCTIKANDEYYPLTSKLKSYLGRPWKEYSRTIIMESFLDDLIQAEGWLPWNETFALDTLFYTEFNNRGPAAAKIGRVKWPGVKELPPDRIQRFTAAQFLDGNQWIPSAHVPYASGFIFPVPKEDPNVEYSPVAPEENKDLGSKANGSDVNGSSGSDPSHKNETGSQSASASPPVSVPKTVIIAPPVTSPTSSPVSAPQSDIATSPYISPSGSPISLPESDTATAPSTHHSGNPAAAPSTYLGGDSAPAAALSPSGSSASAPQQGIVESSADAPTPISPSGGSVSAPQSSVMESFMGAPTPLSPSGTSVLTPQSSVEESYAVAPSPISPSGASVSSPQSSMEESYIGSDSPISPSGSSVSSLQSATSAPPESSYPIFLF